MVVIVHAIVLTRLCREVVKEMTALMDGRVDLLKRNSSLRFELEKAFGAFNSTALLDEPIHTINRSAGKNKMDW